MGFGQSSFRRILLSRLLLLSVPVLLMGVYVTYRKARSAFLETARKNLTQSAILKGESISQSVESLKTNLANASDSPALKSNSVDETLIFIEQLKEILPTNVSCIQFTDLKTNKIVITTCGEAVYLRDSSWEKTKPDLAQNLAQINVNFILPAQNLSSEKSNNNRLSEDQLLLWLSSPVYNYRGELSHSLSVKTSILDREIVQPGTFGGYSVVIDEEGNILAHPSLQKVGLNISQMPDAKRLSSLLRNAIAGKRDFLHLFFLEKDGVELVAGYNSIESPITSKEAKRWVVLAVAPLDTALFPLKDIRQILVIMTVGLIVVSSCANLYISRELARPLEQIRDYALKEEHLQSGDRLPENFRIREFNQLALAMNEMVTRLRSWGDEIITAWKEAKNANQIKSEFLATTSHELRTPLNGIINCIRVVKEGYCDNKEEEIEFLDQADEAAIHLLGIINDVLDISKIEAGKLSVFLERIDLGQLINEIVDLQLVPIQHKGLTYKNPSLPHKIYVRADRAKLKQILLNIIGNAIKFTDSGHIAINVTTNSVETNSHILSSYENYPIGYNSSDHSTPWQSQDSTFLQKNRNDLAPELTEQYIYTEDNRRIVLNKNKNNTSQKTETQPKPIVAKKAIISIQDTGIGIDPNQQSKLFRPFVMVDGSRTRKFGGTGLGLAISKNLIELMNGEISLSSEGLGKGTTITVTVPLAENI